MKNCRFDRQPTEDELADYREQAAQERYEREQEREWSRNAARHPHDPDYVADEE